MWSLINYVILLSVITVTVIMKKKISARFLSRASSMAV